MTEAQNQSAAPGCSMSDVIKAEVERKLAALPEVREVKVEVVFDPPGTRAASPKPPNCTLASTPISVHLRRRPAPSNFSAESPLLSVPE